MIFILVIRISNTFLKMIKQNLVKKGNEFLPQTQIF